MSKLCALCGADVMPHQCAYLNDLAVCFECGGGSWRPTWETFSEKRESGAPAYARLADLRNRREEASARDALVLSAALLLTEMHYWR